MPLAEHDRIEQLFRTPEQEVSIHVPLAEHDIITSFIYRT